VNLGNILKKSHFIWSVQGQEEIILSVNFPETAIMAVSYVLMYFVFHNK